MRGAGITPTYGARLAIPVRPKRAGYDGTFFLEESGLTLSHVHVLEAIVTSAFAAAELEPTDEAKHFGLAGELSLRFRPGDALRAMGLTDGNRAWLRARLKELGSPMGDLPRSLGGGEFSALRTMATDTPSGKVHSNVIVGRNLDGSLVRDAVHASVWTVRLSPGYRAWMTSAASLRHSLLPQLRGLKCAAAEAVARFALTGQCNRPLVGLLLHLAVVRPGWDEDTSSALYRSGRRAINGVLEARDKLKDMGIEIAQTGGRDVCVRAPNLPSGCLFIPGGARLVGEQTSRTRTMPRDEPPTAIARKICSLPAVQTRHVRTTVHRSSDPPHLDEVQKETYTLLTVSK